MGDYRAAAADFTPDIADFDAAILDFHAVIPDFHAVIPAKAGIQRRWDVRRVMSTCPSD